MKITRKVTEEEGNVYVKKATEWLSSTKRFASVPSVAMSAVAEYLANQDGLSLYKVEAEPEVVEGGCEIIPFPPEHMKKNQNESN